MATAKPMGIPAIQAFIEGIDNRPCSWPGCDQVRDTPKHAYCRAHRNQASRESQQRKREKIMAGLPPKDTMYWCRTCKDVRRSVIARRDQQTIIICATCKSERLI